MHNGLRWLVVGLVMVESSAQSASWVPLKKESSYVTFLRADALEQTPQGTRAETWWIFPEAGEDGVASIVHQDIVDCSERLIGKAQTQTLSDTQEPIRTRRFVLEMRPSTERDAPLVRAVCGSKPTGSTSDPLAEAFMWFGGFGRGPAAVRSRWKFLSESASNSLYLYDSTGVHRQGPIREIWLKADHRRDKSVKARSSIALHRFDCDARKGSIVSFVNYDAAGHVIAEISGSADGTGPSPVIPDTVEEAAFNIACS